MPVDLETAKHLIGWTRIDEKALPGIQPVLEAYAPRVLEEFLAYLLEAREISALWAQIGEDSQARLRTILREWLTTRIARPPDEEYIQWARRGGQVHAQLGIRPIYVVSMLEWFRRRLFEIIRVGMGAEGSAVARAMGKIFDLTIALMMEGYVEGRGTRGEG